MVSTIPLTNLESIPDSLLLSCPFHPYRQYKLFGPVAMAALLRQIYQNNRLLGVKRNEQWTALVGFVDLPWDSHLLGLRCARITPLTRLGPCPTEDLVALLKELKTNLRMAGYESVDWEIDSADFQLLSVCQSENFRILDTKLTYLLRAQDQFQRPHRCLFDIRSAAADDHDSILKVAARRFPEMGGRFHADPTLAQGTADRIYLKWLEGALDSKSAYRIKVAFRQNELVGFLCYTLSDEILDATGHRVFSRGLGAVLPGAAGAYLDLLSESILEDYEQGDAAEFETSIANTQACRVFEKLRFRQVRSRYLLKLQKDRSANT